MSVLSNTVLAFSMSADAFAVAIGKGVALKKPKLTHAMRIGCVFGGVEMLTPILGWLIGRAASNAIASIDHWIAFAILAGIGGKMMFEGLQPQDATERAAPRAHMLWLVAIGTSIDSLAVGVTLALMQVNIWVMALAIGAATFFMATLGIMTGHYIGQKAGKAAEFLGGLCLVLIGANIVCEHLGLGLSTLFGI